MKEISVHQKHRVLHITLNRPEKRNALTLAMCSAITQAVDSVQERHDVGAILIHAAGQVFCAGMDVDEAAQPDHPDLNLAHEKLFTMGATSVKPIVICVNGPALGGGVGLVAQGHVVMASETAVFGLPEIRIGLWPFLVYRSVEAALGARRTLELSLVGRVFHAPEAEQWGLVHQLCPPAEICERTHALARDLAKASPRAIAAGMRYFQGSRGKSHQEAGELAATLRNQLMESGEFKEGALAFKQKREPRWPSMPPEFYEHS